MRAISLALLFVGCQDTGRPLEPKPSGGVDVLSGVTQPPTSDSILLPVQKPGGNAAAKGSSDNPVRICQSDADCMSAFPHCLKDVPDEVGLCTRECEDNATCGTGANWLCASARWSLESEEIKNVCALACVLNIECPRATSCSGNFCGTPCVGLNCGPAPACESHRAIDCIDGAVYWFNACYEPEEVKQVCAQGEFCLWGQCWKDDVPSPTPPPPPADGTCSGSIRRCASTTTIVIEDSCGNTLGTDACIGGKECSAGTCRCVRTSQKRCVNGTLWSVDSCGETVSVVGKC